MTYICKLVTKKRKVIRLPAGFVAEQRAKEKGGKRKEDGSFFSHCEEVAI